MKKLLLIFLVTFGLAFNASAQCPFDNSFYVDLTPVSPGSTVSDGCTWGGDLITTTVVAGESYTWSMCGTSWDTELTLYDNTGTIVLAFNDDNCGLQSQFTWVATYSGVVQVMVDQFSCANNSTCGNISVTWNGIAPPPPPNDDCTGAVPVTLTNGTPVNISGTGVGATTGPGDGVFTFAPTVWEAVTLTGACNNLSVAYCLTAPAFLDIWINLATDCPAATTIANSSFENTTCGNGNWIVTYNALPPGTYYIPVLAAEAGFVTPGPYTLTVLSIDCPPPPVNDDCIGAIQIDCGDVIVDATSGGATPDPAAPALCGSVFTTGSNDLWYMIAGDGNDYTVSLCGSTFDTQLQIFEGTCGALNCVTGNDDFCGFQSQVTFTSVAGLTYYVFVNGFGSNSGAFTMTVTSPPPANDDCATATPAGSGVTSGTTRCAGVDVVPVCGTASVPTAGGVWYSYTTLCSGNITASLCTGTAFNSQISVFTGTCGALVCASGNDDFCATQSSVTFPGLAGTTYYILVHGSGSSEGAFDLTISQVDATAPVADVTPLPTINSACGVTLTAPTATDNCAGTIVGTTPIMTFTLNGTYNITWTYNDGNGNTSTEAQQVVINDAIPPTMICHNDTVLSNNPGICGAVLAYYPPSCLLPVTYYDQVDDIANDNGFFMEAALPQYIADDFLVPALATWSIETFSATLWEQPAGAMTSLTVDIHSDGGGVPGPIISTQVLTAADWTSTPVGSAFGYTISSFDFVLPTPVSGLTGGAGGTTYWLSIYDNFSFFQVAWEITNTITGTSGQFSGSPTGPWNPVGPTADLVFKLGGSLPGTVTDNCPSCATVVQTAGLAPGSVFPTGTTTNTFVATDAAGNTSTCSFDVTVNDTELPVPTMDSVEVYTFISTDLPVLCPDLTTTMDSVLVSGIPTILNSGDLKTVCLDIDHTWDSDMTISLISPGGTTFILSDANGLNGDDYIQTCFDMSAATNINSATAPFIGTYIPEGAGGFDNFNGENPNGYWKLAIFDAVSGDQGVLYDFRVHFDFQHDSVLPVLHTDCSTLTAPTAMDNCDGVINATTTDPTSYAADGTYLVHWTYTDAAGNAYVQTQQVIVDDVTAPVPTLGSLPIVAGSCTATVSATPTANDACAGVINGTTTDVLVYNTAGTYTVTWTYNDGNGNITTQTQTVVVSDNTPPVPTLPILPNVIGNCVVTATAPTATDNCAGLITGTTTDPTTYNILGTFFIIWHYNDNNGNVWTQNQTVTVNPCLGVEDESGQWNAMIYPNPSNGIFTLTLSEMPVANTEMRLVNSLGQVIYSEMIQGQIQQFDFSQLASATYYVLITSNNGQISKPVIIKHND